MDKETKMMILCLLVAALSSPVFSEEWKASVIKNLETLVSSCVVVPCSFTYPKEKLPSSRLRAIWHLSGINRRDDRIYYEDKTRVLENFRGRTRLLGHLGQNNCTLEITEIKDHDNGPFCFRIELAGTDTSAADKFSFVDDCVTLAMLPEPPKPTVINPKEAVQDHHHILICSVTHTCPSHQPKLTWSKGTAGDVTEIHREIHFGYWEAQSILTFTPGETDDHSQITCTALFHGHRMSSTTLTLYVKRIENYNHIIIPAVVGIGTAVIFTVVCIFMVKKYKRRIAELQSQDGSMWNRLSRMSRRMRSADLRPDQRKPKRDVCNLNDLPKPVKSKSCADQKTPKPRFPSPKSQPKSCNNTEDLDDGDDYINTADLNIYGNL